MATQKTIIETKYVDLCATFNYNPKGKQVIWKKRVFAKEDIKKRKHLPLTDDGQAIATGLSCRYTFKKDEAEKYLQIYAYINELKKIDQSVLIYAEPQYQTDIRIKPKSVKADKPKATVGEMLKCTVGYHNPKKQKDIPEKDVPQSTKDNVKWMVKVDGKTDRLIIDEEVMRGGSISFKIPKEWENKEVLLMPYLNKYDESISCKIIITKNLTITTKAGVKLFTLDGTSYKLYGELTAQELYKKGYSGLNPRLTIIFLWFLSNRI